MGQNEFNSRYHFNVYALHHHYSDCLKWHNDASITFNERRHEWVEINAYINNDINPSQEEAVHFTMMLSPSWVPILKRRCRIIPLFQFFKIENKAFFCQFRQIDDRLWSPLSLHEIYFNVLPRLVFDIIRFILSLTLSIDHYKPVHTNTTVLRWKTQQLLSI